MLAGATAAATYLQAALSVLSVYLTADLGMTRSQIGIVFAVLSVVGGLAAPLAGSIADRSTRLVMIGLFSASSVSVLVTASAPHYLWVLVAAAIGGIGFSAGNPVTNRLVFEEISAPRHGLAIGIKQAGPPAGLLAAGLVIPPLASLIGWRWAFALTALVPLLGIAATRALVPATLPGPAGLEAGGAGPRRRQGSVVRWLTWTSLVVSAGTSAVIAFIPLYAHQQLGLSKTAAGMVAALMGLFGMAGRVAWGAGGHRFRGTTTGLTAIAVAALAATLMVWSATAVPWLIWVAAVAVGLSMPGWHVVAWLVLLDASGSAGIGRSTGVVQLGTAIGFAAGPPLMGVVVDTGSYSVGWTMVAGIFVVGIVLMMIWRLTGGSPPRPGVVAAE